MSDFHKVLEEVDQLIERHDWESALEKINQHDSSSKIDIQLRKLLLLIKLQKFDESEICVEKLEKAEFLSIDQELVFFQHKNDFYWNTGKIGDLDESLNYHERLLQISQSEGEEVNSEHFVNFHRLRGLYCWHTGDLQEAELHGNLALNYVSKVEEKRRPLVKGGIYLLLGLVNRHKGNLDEAILYYKECAEIFRNLDLRENLAKVLNNLGIAYRSQSRYNEAITVYNEAMEISQKGRNKSELCKIWLNLGSIDREMGNLEGALQKYQKSLHYANEMNLTNHKIGPLNNIALIYKDYGKLNKAYEYYFRALQCAKKVHSIRAITLILPNISAIHVYQGDFEKVYETYDQFLEYYQNYDDPDLSYVPNQIISKLKMYEGNFEAAKELEVRNVQIAMEGKRYFRAALSLYNLITIALQADKLQDASIWLQELAELDDKSNMKIQNYHEFSSLMIESHRNHNKYSSELFNRFEDVSQRTNNPSDVVVHSHFYMMELLLDKLAVEGDTEDLDRLQVIESNLLNFANDQNMFDLQFQVKQIISKTKLLEFKIEEARSIIDEIITDSGTMGYNRIQEDAIGLKDEIISGESRWLKFKATNPLMVKRIEMFDIIKFVKSKGNSYLASPTF